MQRAGAHIRGNVVAYLALFFALGGIAGAAAQPLLDRPRSVESSHIAPGAVGKKKLAPGMRARVDAPLPVDGYYAGHSGDGSLNIGAQVFGGQITDMAVIGSCEWRVKGGGYDSNGNSWTYQSAGPGERAMQAFGEVADERTLRVDMVLTGVLGSGVHEECDGPVVLTPQPTGR